MNSPDSVGGTPERMAGPAWDTLPLALGAYLVSCDGGKAAFAVSVLGNAVLVGKVARARPAGLCIAGWCEIGDIGMDKAIRDTITLPRARYLIVCGTDQRSRSAGSALLSLKANATTVPPQGVSKDEVEVFREHIDLVDMTWTDDVETIVGKIDELSRSCPQGACGDCVIKEKPVSAQRLPSVSPWAGGLDPAGFFIIRPDAEKGTLTVEHYFYDCRLVRSISGRDKRAIFRAIIDNGWATQASHVAYLWRELARAERALRKGLRYVQDIEPL
ncbi:DUF4346 domain-containing protein [Methanocella conradii]|uniref:DUF4346 domain-containing protein n=1 Tax=Methanocella conradii TaxID=1175444 RepID=UPI0024B344A4|nr:hypothetical protein [Methanocella conradii]MDI6895825.1 hypothetical protein [Methanocella conradii]